MMALGMVIAAVMTDSSTEDADLAVAPEPAQARFGSSPSIVASAR
jgi:hypothetical protein